MGSRGRLLVDLALEKAEKARNATNTSGDYRSGSRIEHREDGIPGYVPCDDGYKLYNNSFEDTQVMDLDETNPPDYVTSQVHSAEPATVPVPDINMQPATHEADGIQRLV